MTEILISLITMGGLGLLFSIGLILAYKKLRVEEDPLVAKIEEFLPGVNCGACGYSGCWAYAEAVASGQSEANKCSVGGEEVIKRISDLLGIEIGQTVKKTGRIHCQGSLASAKFKGNYRGINSCYAAHLIGGNKLCQYGCLWLGDCVRVCPFDAIYLDRDGLPVIIEEKCLACGKCVEACPRGIIEILPNYQKVIIFCRNQNKGAIARKLCKNACLACGICARACPEAIAIENYLALIVNPDRITPDCQPKLEKCPTKAIRVINK
ncbi:MAG: RnfABCDGE type electron transport complex subunit B [Candidatus Aminicenantia bacterium]